MSGTSTLLTFLASLAPASCYGSCWGKGLCCGGLWLWFPNLNPSPTLSNPPQLLRKPLQYCWWGMRISGTHSQPGNGLADLKSLGCSHLNTLSAESRRKDNPSKLSGNPHKQLPSWRGSSFFLEISPDGGTHAAGSCQPCGETGRIKNKNWLSENKIRPDNSSHSNQPWLADGKLFVQRGWQGGCGGNCLEEELWECAPLLRTWGLQQYPAPPCQPLLFQLPSWSVIVPVSCRYAIKCRWSSLLADSISVNSPTHWNLTPKLILSFTDPHRVVISLNPSTLGFSAENTLPSYFSSRAMNISFGGLLYALLCFSFYTFVHLVGDFVP